MTDVEVILPAVPFDGVDAYRAADGGAGIAAARALGPDGTIDEILASGLRGRGGGGFPTGTKWRSVRDSGGGVHYVVANGAEGEPATFKDRMLMHRDPYRIVEGAAIAACAVGATDVFIATKRSFSTAVARLRRAALELGREGILGDITIGIVEGPDDYLYGEETALLEVVEGRDPLPRLLPPWQHGLFATVPSGGWEAESAGISDEGRSNPTVANNVETLAASAHILARGASWYRTFGTLESPGTIIATVVGDVVHPGVHEVELGTPLSALIERCGGARPGRTLRAAFSGVSNPVIRAEDFDVPLSYEGMRRVGSGLGAAGFAVYDDTADLVDVAREYSRFLAVESCGQCPPCKQGCTAITDALTSVQRGEADDRVLGVLNRLLGGVTDANRCYLGSEEQNVVASVLRMFPEDVAAHLEGRAPEVRRPIAIPLVDDIAPDGAVTYHRHDTREPGG